MLVFLQQVINGLAQGGIYSLIAIGWTTVFGIVGVINWTHGEIYMLGAYTGYFVSTYGSNRIYYRFRYFHDPALYCQRCIYSQPQSVSTAGRPETDHHLYYFRSAINHQLPSFIYPHWNHYHHGMSGAVYQAYSYRKGYVGCFPGYADLRPYGC